LRIPLNFFSLRESEEQKSLPAIFEFIVFTLFFVQKKSVAKEVKKRAVLSLYQ